MFRERPLLRCPRYAADFSVVEVERCHGAVGLVCHENLATGSEECIEPLPAIGENGSATGGSFEQPAGWTPAQLSHRSASDVQCQARRGEERRMLRWRQMADEIQIGRPWKILRVLCPADQKAPIRALPRRNDQQR